MTLLENEFLSYLDARLNFEVVDESERESTEKRTHRGLRSRGGVTSVRHALTDCRLHWRVGRCVAIFLRFFKPAGPDDAHLAVNVLHLLTA